MNNVAISVRISRELKGLIERYGVRVSEVVGKALEEEVTRRKLEEAAMAARELGELFAKLSAEEVVSMIKEARSR
ncbi:MAG: hypothetical protein DRJ97_01530 [Thermoprotei archaeon]|nr:MAG: hypothetical protein DRJ97_01530 [Thermoprotei archaeon]